MKQQLDAKTDIKGRGSDRWIALYVVVEWGRRSYCWTQRRRSIGGAGMDGLRYVLSCRMEVAKLLVEMKADIKVWDGDKWLNKYIRGVVRCNRGGVRWQ
jgi:hypothetical protein